MPYDTWMSSLVWSRARNEEKDMEEKRVRQIKDNTHAVGGGNTPLL